ncbi:porin OmpA [Testudinibacter sp. TR-2022]|uniref:porin OmpA n=1 Tax=Testudinibacter sp. TR-2022 TaxID=2585029 RepID=UPI00111964F1|nr:porin OmpA [Testudinibacter sp. TR-2022]TNH04820.1 porin OmpA [Pasteurellaceae bacterium Phil31]TNH04649.1 porin OmpA [Testudinibacter sp. TR-2022]TNH07960.1 porin OmpA [Testudinibacter sp. TR-2022]TNH13898.1 porin OmpA [Testudinibacter sp. TR-2022]TNH14082.1 porin OmpA [Testudinibacter sp. TR-2022]
MKKTAIVLAISGLALASAAQAAPQANTFYAGAKAGWASYHDGLTQFERLDGLKTGHQRNSVTYGVFGGYQITDNLAVELGYDDFGRNKVKYKGQTIGKHTAHGTHLTLKASYPVLADLDVYARVGAALVRSDYKTYDDSFVGSGFPGRRGHDLSTSAVFAGGLEYAIIPSLALRVEYQWLNNVGKKSNSLSTDYRPDVGSVTAGLSYRFGQGVAAPEVVTKKFAFSSDVLFDFNKSSLKAGGSEALDGMTTEVANSGLASPNYNVAGYTDRIGSDAYNQKLSEKRAETVANYLVSKGVEQTNVTAVGYGKANPVTGSNCDTVKGRKALIACLAPDRRVEVSVQGAKTVTM